MSRLRCLPGATGMAPDRCFLTVIGVAVALTTSMASAAQETFTDVNPNQSSLADADGASGGRVNGLATVAGNNTIYYAATEWGGLYTSTNTGRNWAPLNGHLPTATWDVEVDPSNANRLYATSFYDGRVNSLAGINVSTDAGVTWTHPASATPPSGLCLNARRNEPSAFGISIDPANNQSVYIGTNCGLAISTNSGVTWIYVDPTPVDLANNVWDVVVHDGGIIDVCGDDGHLRSTDGGTTWTSGTGLPSGRCSIAVSPDEANVLFVTVGRNIYESDDGGTTWTNLGTPDARRQGRIPFVATNKRSGNSFDLWFGDVRLYRGGCTSNPAGGGLRCPMARTGAPAATPPAGWNGPFTRSVGGHDDVGDIAFDAQAASNACPMIFSSDGGVYFNTVTTSPGCHTPAWQEPNVTPHALWLWALDGANQAGTGNEDLYLGNQDNGSFATTNAGAALPTWANINCCDVFDIAADPVRVVYDVCCGFTLRVGGPGMTAVAIVVPNPPGLIPQFRFPDFIARFGPNQYIAVTSSGAYLTNSITSTPVTWTQIGAASTPAGGFCAVKASVAGGTPTFYAQAGACRGRTQDRIWSYTGTGTGGTWQAVTPPSGGFSVFAVDPNNPNRLLASNLILTGPQMIFSTDGGATWQNLAVLDNLMTGGGAFQYQVQRGPLNWTVFGTYPQPTLVAFDREDSNIIVAGARNSGVFLSTDGGEDWRLITDPFNPATSGIPHLPRPQFAYFDHEPSNQVNLYVGTQGRGVWRINFFRPPVANADGPYTTNVGVTVTLDGTGSGDVDGGALTFEWDFDADGNFNDGTGATPVFGGSFVTSAGVFPVALRVTDLDGATDVDQTTVTVGAVAAGGGLRTGLSLHAGVAVPLGTLNSLADPGPTINADFIYAFTPQLGADLRLGYSLFNGVAPASDVDIWNLSANLKFVPMLSTPWVFVNGGLGLYYIDTTDLEGGLNLGAGLGQPLSPNFDLEVTANYHRTFTASQDVEFFKFQVGLIWAF